MRCHLHVELLTALLVVGTDARAAHAQAWLPSPGEGTVTIQYQNVLSKDHFVPTACDSM